MVLGAVDEDDVVADAQEGGAERAADRAGAPDEDRRAACPLRSRPADLRSARGSRRPRCPRSPACPRPASGSSRRNCRRRGRRGPCRGPSSASATGRSSASSASAARRLRAASRGSSPSRRRGRRRGRSPAPWRRSPARSTSCGTSPQWPGLSAIHSIARLPAGWLPPWPLTIRMRLKPWRFSAVEDVADDRAHRSRCGG